MGTKVFALRIGEKFGQDVEDYINSKIPNVTWIRDELDGVRLQWNKMRVMNMDIDEPVVVIDIDLEFINDYMDAINYPIERGQFLSARSWWRDTIRTDVSYSVNGGFFKYYPKDCKYIYDKFMKDKFYWQRYYIENNITVGPVNGEQYFVEDSVRERLKLKLLPVEWFTRWKSGFDSTDEQMIKWQWNTTKKYKQLTGNSYVYLGDFHPDIKYVHFTHSHNKPSDWKNYTKIININTLENS